MRNIFTVIGLLLFLVGSSLIFFSFNDDAVSGFSPNAAAATVVPFTTIAKGVQTTLEGRVNYVISSPEEMQELWKMVGATSTPPVVDFKSQMIVAVLGDRKYGKHESIAVSKIEDSNTRTVFITVGLPEKSCGGESVYVGPYEIISMPSTALPLEHKDAQVPAPCLK